MMDKIFRAISMVAIIVLLASLLLSFFVLYGYFNQGFQSTLKSSAAYISEGVESNGLSYLQALPEEALRITWISADGTVLFDTLGDADSLENHLQREEIVEAQKNGVGSSTRYSKTYGEKTYYYAKRLADGSFLRVADTQHSVTSILWNMAQPIALIFLTAIVLSAVIGTRLSRQIVAPLNQLDLGAPEQCKAYPEITPLIRRIRTQNLVISEQIEQLERQQQEFAQITERMPEGLLILDQAGILLSKNDSAARLLGLPADTLCIGAELFTLPFDNVLQNAVREALSGVHAERHWLHDEQHILITASPVVTSGNVSGAVVVLLDETEKERGDAMRREFTANVSHELKTPLTVISGTAEILKDGLVKPEDVRHFGENIYLESQRLIALVNDILELSRLDENVQAPEKTDVELHTVAESVCDRLHDTALSHGVTLRLRGIEVHVNGVARILDEIIYNLVDNAIKYNRAGGFAEVETAMRDGRAVLIVRDNGIGIPPAHQARIFERFYRVDKSHSRAIGGTGLGLSIVKHGAAFHNAEVSLESEPGIGTTIEIRF